MRLKSRKDFRVRRHLRIRKRVSGTADRPRMAISISERHMYVQFIDDDNAVTLAAVSTVKADEGKNVAGAQELGKRAAEAATSKGIQQVVVDRGGRKYHGRIKAIVESAIEGGLSNTASKTVKEES